MLRTGSHRPGSSRPFGMLGVGLLAVAATVLGGCVSAAEYLGMKLIYDPVPWPDDRIVRDLAYLPEASPDFDAGKHRLDLFLPEPPAVAGASGSAADEVGFPTLVFVHGGGWDEGDKSLEVGGQEIYGNIGRFYAAEGYAVAVINYRLQPEVTWRDQVHDVARALAWLAQNVGSYGGDPERIVLSGHSAGAQLATFVTLSAWPLDATGFERSRLCGVIAVSGAGYDLEDPMTYELGAEPEYYEARFSAPGDRLPWDRSGSALRHLSPAAPPFLVAYAEDEWPSLHRQARLLHQGLREVGVASRLHEIPDLGHRRIVVSLSQDDGPLDDAVLAFLAERSSACRNGGRGDG